MLTKANIVTLARIALIPAFMILLLAGTQATTVAAVIIFVVASATDWVDGFLARKYNEVTTFGKFIDPLADKLLVTAALLIFVQHGHLASWAAMLIIAREFIITSLRLVALAKGEVLAADFSGKLKTIVQISCTIFILVIGTEQLYNLLGHSAETASQLALWAGYLMVAVTLWSGVDYLVRHRDVLK
ncbi:MAG: CDP-diacylglycerol--glycerol-3-phosphate 3-phosphatidyltransferase [Oscillospiraceae bacterium]|nr:CDP-diacylglycerol--glycerol-3-phosphate 3-phosphatidyltransferase [Oscillospiraceae bacterium]